MRRILLVFFFLFGAAHSQLVEAGCGPSDLAVTLADAPDPVTAGNVLDYTVTVQNLDGANSGCDVVATLDLPAGTSFVTSSGCAEDPTADAICSLGQIGPGFSKAANFKVTVDADTSGPLEADVSISSSSGDANSSNDTDDASTTVVFEASLSLNAVADREIALPGDVLTYLLSVTNAGPSDASNTEITIVLPGQVTFLDSSGCVDDPAGVPVCRLQTVSANETAMATLRVRVADDAAGQLLLRAEVSSAADDPDPADDDAEVRTPVSLETRVGEGSAPAIAADPAGSESFTVVWQGTPAAPLGAFGRAGDEGEGIFARVFDAFGMPVGIEMQLTDAGSEHRAPDVATYDEGRFVAVWQGEDGDGGGVFARRFDAFGMPVGIEMQLNQSAAFGQSDPAVVGLPGTGFAVTWVDEESLGSYVHAMRVFDAFGMPVGIEMRFGASDVAPRAPAVALSSSQILATWRDAAGRVAGQFFDAFGMPVGIELQITQGGASSRPAVAPHGDGGFVVVWQDDDGSDSDGGGIFGRRLDAFGMPVGIEFQANTLVAGDQGRPGIAAAPDGTFAVTWQGPDGDGTGIYARRLDPFGMPVGIEQRMSRTSAGNQEEAEPVFIDTDGTFYVTWQSDDDGGSDIIVSPQDALFADGFEDGNLSAWSTSSP